MPPCYLGIRLSENSLSFTEKSIKRVITYYIHKVFIQELEIRMQEKVTFLENISSIRLIFYIHKTTLTLILIG